MDDKELRSELEYLQTILSRIDPEAAAWVAELIPLAQSHSDLLWRRLNDRRLWGGAGAIANQPLQAPPEMDPWQWHEDIRQFREIMIRLGEMLRKRGGENPDIDAWLLAFHNWNSVGA
jgi:hypothetical protein